jgi:membrane-associated phospholipid phosphatase
MLIFSGCISALMVKVLILQPAGLHRTLISRITEPPCSMPHNYMKQILKRMIKQPRPHQPDGQDYGMPSSHAASVCFFSTAIVLYQAHFIGVIACM